MEVVGTVITLIAVVAQCYSRCENVSKSFYNLHVDLRSLRKTLLMVKRYVPEGEDLGDIQKGCNEIVEEIEKLVSKYEGIGTAKKKLWRTFRWHFEDIAVLRSRLGVQVAMLNVCVRSV